MKFLQRLFGRRTRNVQQGTLNLDMLKARLWAMRSEDILWPQLMALLEAYALAEARAASSPALDDAEAHRLRGRMGMCFDLKQDLEKLMAEAQAMKGK